MSGYCSHHPAECNCSDEELAFAAVPSLERAIEAVQCGPSPIECGDDSTDDATGNHCPAHQEIYDDFGPEVEASMNTPTDDFRDAEEARADYRANHDEYDERYS